MRILATLAACLLLAGCVSVPSPSVTQAVTLTADHGFQFVSDADLGDVYLQVEVELPAEATCTVDLFGQGHARTATDTYLTWGWWTATHASAVDTVRAVFPVVSSSAANSTAVTNALFPPDYAGGPSASPVPFHLDAGRATVFWTAEGIRQLGLGYGPVTLRAGLDCSAPFKVVGRGFGKSVIVAESSTPTTAGMAPLTLESQGTVVVPQAGSHAALHIEGSGGDGTLVAHDGATSSSFQFPSGVPAGIVATLPRLDSVTIDWRPDPNAAAGLTTGYFDVVAATYEDVDAFPSSGLVSLRAGLTSSTRDTRASQLWTLDLDTPQSVTCDLTVGAVGTVTGQQLSRVFGVFTNDSLDQKFVTESAPVGPSDETSSTYGDFLPDGITLPFILPAGHSTAFWAATMPSAMRAGLDCPAGVSFGARHVARLALLSRVTGRDGTVAVPLGQAGMSHLGPFASGPSGLALVCVCGDYAGQVSAAWDGGSWQSGPELASAVLHPRGNLTLDATSAGSGLWISAVLGQMGDVGSLPSETTR